MLCDGNKWESEECIEWNHINNIIYNALPHNIYASNANLRVQVNWAEIYENDHPGLRNEVVSLPLDASFNPVYADECIMSMPSSPTHTAS